MARTEGTINDRLNGDTITEPPLPNVVSIVPLELKRTSVNPSSSAPKAVERPMTILPVDWSPIPTELATSEESIVVVATPRLPKVGSSAPLVMRRATPGRPLNCPATRISPLVWMAAAGALGKDEPPAIKTPPEPKVGSSLPAWANAGSVDSAAAQTMSNLQVTGLGKTRVPAN